MTGLQRQQMLYNNVDHTVYIECIGGVVVCGILKGASADFVQIDIRDADPGYFGAVNGIANVPLSSIMTVTRQALATAE